MDRNTIGRMTGWMHIFLGLSALTLWAGAANAAAPFFSGIGDVPGGSFRSEASAVSNRGVVAVGVTGEEVLPPPLPGLPPLVLDLSMGAIWTQQGGLDLLPLDVTAAIDISADGEVVLARRRDGSVGDFLYTEAGGLIPLGTGVLARALSDDGTTVVGRLSRPDLSTHEAFRWTALTGVVGLGFLPATNPRSEAYDVSSDGKVVTGDAGNIQLSPGFRWTEGVGMEHMDPLAAGAQTARVISGDGVHIAGTSPPVIYIWSESLGYRFVENTFNVGLSKLPTAMNMDGSVLVGGSNQLTFSEAFIWDSVRGMRQLSAVLEDEYGLDLTGWTLTRANSISPNGRWIVGDGINPAGDREGWVAFLGSSACGLGFELVLVLGPLALFRFRRSRS